MKATCMILLLLGSLSVQGEGQSALNGDIQAVKRSVLQLNKELYELEENLLSPATMRAAFYLSLSHGEFFEPLSIEITAPDMQPVQHIYTGRQVKALRMGAVQPLGNVNLGPGEHTVRIVIRGVDHSGKARELITEENVIKADQPLLMEIVILDQNERKSAVAQLKQW